MLAGCGENELLMPSGAFLKPTPKPVIVLQARTLTARVGHFGIDDLGQIRALQRAIP